MVIETIIAIILTTLFITLLIPSIINFITAFFSLKEQEEYRDYFPRVSVIIRAWNDENVLKRCIENYLNQNYPTDQYEIIIVDDGSTDKTELICRQYEKQGKIRYIKFPKHNTHKAVVVDYAIKNFSTGEIILETDVDAVFKPNFLAEMMKPFSDPKISAATGTVYAGNWYKSLISMIRAIENFWWLSATMFGRFKWTGQGFLYGGCKSYRKSVWEEIGGHSTKTLVEDAEMAATLISKGYKIAIVKNTPILQEEVETWPQYQSEQRRWISGDLEVTKKYKKELATDRFYQLVMYSNFSTDGLFLGSILLSFFNPLFLIPLIINLISIWLVLWGYNAKPAFFLYSIPYIIIGPILHLIVLIELIKFKITGKKVDWTKVWHYPTQLTWPTNN